METVIDGEYTDDLVFLANTSTQAKSLLHGMEQPARNIGLYMYTDKIKFMYFKIR